MKAVLKKEATVVQDAEIISETKSSTAVAEAPAQPVQTAPKVVTQAPSLPPAAPVETPVEAEKDIASTSLALPKDVGPISGEFNDSDVRFPRLQIVQGNGELAAIHAVGSLLYMDEVLFPPTLQGQLQPSMRYVPIILHKQYREKKPLNKDDLPRVANTALEVRNLGGTLEKIGDEPATWAPCATAVLLLEKPEGVEHAGFGIEINGKLYGLTRYYASGGAYKFFAQTIFNASKFYLRENGKELLWKQFWSMKVVRKAWGEHTIFVPETKVVSEITSKEIREVCEGAFSMATGRGEAAQAE